MPMAELAYWTLLHNARDCVHDRGGPMGKLYDDCMRIQEHIETSGLDVFRTRGEIAMRCGFLVSLVRPTDTDDPRKIQALEHAARDLLGITL